MVFTESAKSSVVEGKVFVTYILAIQDMYDEVITNVRTP